MHRFAHQIAALEHYLEAHHRAGAQGNRKVVVGPLADGCHSERAEGESRNLSDLCGLEIPPLAPLGRDDTFYPTLRLPGAGVLQAITPELWPAGKRLVMQQDTALELGSPAVGSTSALLWSAPFAPNDDDIRWRMHRIGPDLPELAAQEQPPNGFSFGQLVWVRGRFEDPYERYLDLKEVLYDLPLDGLTLRSMPSQQQLWFRLHRDAVGAGFSLRHLGGALINNLRQLDFVDEVDILFHTADKAGLAPLQEIAQDAGRVVGALVKSNEEPNAECDACEYNDICEEKEHVAT